LTSATELTVFLASAEYAYFSLQEIVTLSGVASGADVEATLNRSSKKPAWQGEEGDSAEQKKYHMSNFMTITRIDCHASSFPSASTGRP
jgi:hypothetical protein